MIKYVVKRGTLYLADGQGCWHWELSQAWFFDYLADMLYWVNEGDEIMAVRVTTTFEEIGVLV